MLPTSENTFSPTVQAWVNVLGTRLLQTGIRPDAIRKGNGFVVDRFTLLALMGNGARLITRMDNGNAAWLTDTDNNNLGIGVRVAILPHLHKDGLVEMKSLGWPYNEHQLTRNGKKEALEWAEKKEAEPVKEVVKEEAVAPVKAELEVPKEEEPKVNKAILDHAVGPYAEGYMLQIVFSDLEALVRAAKGMGIAKPKMEVVEPMDGLGRTAPVAQKEMIVHQERAKLEADPHACAACGVHLKGGGKAPKSGYRFCMNPKCQTEKYLLNKEMVKESKAS